MYWFIHTETDNKILNSVINSSESHIGKTNVFFLLSILNATLLTQDVYHFPHIPTISPAESAKYPPTQF
jgi:hypothetical protein